MKQFRFKKLDAFAAGQSSGNPAGMITVDSFADITVDEMQQIGPLLDIHPRAVEEIIDNTDGSGVAAQRTKLERFPHCVLLYLYRSVLDENNELKLHESPVIMTAESIISVQHEHPIDRDALLARWQQNPDLLEYGVPALLHGLLDLVVDSYLDSVDALSDAVDAMEDDLFDSSGDRVSDPREAQMRSFATRKSLVRLRRVAQPMREVVSGLMRHEEGDRPSVVADLQPYYQDVYDHVLRVNDTIEGLRDLITTIYETRLALNDHSLNTVTRQLAAWAAIIAVPTAVTGFYGQNIPYPGFAQHSGFWTSTVIWVGVSVVLYAMFKRRRWL